MYRQRREVWRSPIRSEDIEFGTARPVFIGAVAGEFSGDQEALAAETNRRDEAQHCEAFQRANQRDAFEQPKGLWLGERDIWGLCLQILNWSIESCPLQARTLVCC